MRPSADRRVMCRWGGAGREALLSADHVHDGVDEREVCQGLREVAEVTAAAGDDLSTYDPRPT